MNTFQRTLASLLAGGAAIAAGPAMAQVSVNTPGDNPAAPTAINAGPVNVQSGPAGTTVNVPPGAANAAAAVVDRIGENAAVRQERRQERIEDRQAAREDWRMRYHNGAWWHWGPNNQWSVYQNNAWTPYAPGGASTPPPVPAANSAVAPGTTYQPTQAYRRGPLGVRRYSMGYRGTVAQPAPAPTPAAPTSNAPAPQPAPGAPTSPPTTSTPEPASR